MKFKASVSILLLAGLFACGKAPKHQAGFVSDQSPIEGENKDLDSNGMPKKPGMLTCSTAGAKTYKGFGNVELTAGRVTEIPAEGDRFRVKPLSALRGDYQRVFGAVPSSLEANASTFAAAPDRWFVEPVASAITLFTTYRVSYQAALTLAGTDPKYAAAPTEATAATACESFARLTWNKVPSKDQVAACVKIAVVDTAAETDAKARWAYALASVMASTGFISY